MVIASILYFRIECLYNYVIYNITKSKFKLIKKNIDMKTTNTTIIIVKFF